MFENSLLFAHFHLRLKQKTHPKKKLYLVLLLTPCSILDPFHHQHPIELLLPIPGFAEIRTTMFSDDCKIIFAYKRSCKSVMLSQVSVCQSFCPQGGFPMWPLPMMHWYLCTYPLPSNMGLGSSLTSSGGYTQTVMVGKQVVRILIECILAIWASIHFVLKYNK